jgi:hypothetical protein
VPPEDDGSSGRQKGSTGKSISTDQGARQATVRLIASLMLTTSRADDDDDDDDEDEDVEAAVRIILPRSCDHTVVTLILDTSGQLRLCSDNIFFPKSMGTSLDREPRR